MEVIQTTQSTQSTPLVGAQRDQVIKFIRAAVPVLLKQTTAKRKDGSAFTGVHVVYGKFNLLFKATFPSLDVRAVTKQLEQEKIIAMQTAKGGAMLYLWDSKPANYAGPSADASDLLAEINATMARQLAALDEPSHVELSEDEKLAQEIAALDGDSH